MQSFQKRYIILVIVLSVFCAAILWVNLTTSAKRTGIDIHNIPLEVDQWHGEELPVEENVKQILETKSVLMREYTKGAYKVWLAVVYYENSRVSLHLPESCYSGEGSDIVKRDQHRIIVPGTKEFYANKLIVRGNKGNRVVLYYFMTRDLCTGSYKNLRWNMMLNKIKYQINSGALIRFSVPLAENQEQAINILEEFIRLMSPLLIEYLG
jgi:EpsI family protein